MFWWVPGYLWLVDMMHLVGLLNTVPYSFCKPYLTMKCACMIQSPHPTSQIQTAQCTVKLIGFDHSLAWSKKCMTQGPPSSQHLTPYTPEAREPCIYTLRKTLINTYCKAHTKQINHVKLPQMESTVMTISEGKRSALAVPGKWQNPQFRFSNCCFVD